MVSPRGSVMSGGCLVPPLTRNPSPHTGARHGLHVSSLGSEASLVCRAAPDGDTWWCGARARPVSSFLSPAPTREDRTVATNHHAFLSGAKGGRESRACLHGRPRATVLASGQVTYAPPGLGLPLPMLPSEWQEERQVSTVVVLPVRGARVEGGGFVSVPCIATTRPVCCAAVFLVWVEAEGFAMPRDACTTWRACGRRCWRTGCRLRGDRGETLPSAGFRVLCGSAWLSVAVTFSKGLHTRHFAPGQLLGASEPRPRWASSGVPRGACGVLGTALPTRPAQRLRWPHCPTRRHLGLARCSDVGARSRDPEPGAYFHSRGAALGTCALKSGREVYGLGVSSMCPRLVCPTVRSSGPGDSMSTLSGG
ncbi:hypothetical protein TREES_T100021462 [Tupaia chinensis]|uniref:Uncharacterized protein n=1 Tax=Tupaia chinensis TaxID=246437 RepID=L9KHZ1_TUPCH|nr:hypothetical protein TREES_T100021462 [Tupaia chinensis]